MNNLTISLRILTTTIVFSVLALAVVANQPQVISAQTAVPESGVRSLVNEASGKGLSCTKEPALTDDIIFTTTDGQTKWLTFDEALAGSQDGKGTVELYCTR